MVNLAWHGPSMVHQSVKSSTTWQELNAMLAAKPGTGTTGSHTKISPPPPPPHHHHDIFYDTEGRNQKVYGFGMLLKRFGSPNSGFGTL